MPSAYRRLVLTLLTTLSLALSTLLLAPAARAADTGVVNGVVKAKPSTTAAAPLAGAGVYLQRDGTAGWYGTTTTDAQGRYSFPGLPSGTYRLLVEPPAGNGAVVAEYYDNAWRGSYAWSAITVGTGTVALRDVVLEPAAWVRGRVTDQDGAPVPSAAVSVAQGPNQGGQYVFTDAQGRYDTRTSPTYGDQTLPPLIGGAYVVSSSGPEDRRADANVYFADTETVTAPAGGGAVADLVIVRQKTVVFTVRDSTGQPVAEAPVTLKIKREANGGFGDPQYGPITTDSDGRFRLTESQGLAFQLAFHPEDDATGDDVSEWWDGAEGAARQAGALAVDWPTSAPMRRDHTVRLGPLTGPTPQVTGTARRGSTLTAGAGTWSPAAPTLAYQWLADGTVIAGATGRTLALTDGQVGKRISVRVTGTHEGRSVSRTSAQTAAVEALLVPATPTVSGDLIDGSTLTAVPGAWAPTGTTFTYRWLADGEEIAGATEPTLPLTAEQVGQRISVRVSGTHGTQSAERTSAPTEPIADRLVAATPTIVGTARAGSTLTARPGAWTPTAARLTYQWHADGVAIRGATAPALRLGNAQAGKRITVVVTGVAGAQQASGTSRATAAVVGVLTAPKPRISGKAKVGKRLTVKTGAWGPGKVRTTYQWLRNGKVIKGATKASYKLGTKDRGKRIQVRVTGSRTSYATASTTSVRTAKVKR